MIESALSMKMGKNEALHPPIDKASKAFEEAGLTEEQKFVFLSKDTVKME